MTSPLGYRKIFKQIAHTSVRSDCLMDKTDDLELMGYNVTKSIRIDDEMAKKLQKITLFEKTKEGTLLRQWIHHKIMTYYKNPDFKRWLKQLTLIPMTEKRRQ